MKVYEFRVKLKNYSPSMWRRFQIKSDAPLTELGYVILSVYKANASHLIQFYDKGRADYFHPLRCFAFPSSNSLDEEYDIRDYKIKDIFNAVEEAMIFNYDFGDDWEFEVTLKKIIDKDASTADLPVVISGKGYGIIDDCGGVWGLAEIARAFEKGEGEEYERYCDWLGCEEIDLKTFDIDEANDILQDEIEELKIAYEDEYEFF
jgi:hypothetical protein